MLFSIFTIKFLFCFVLRLTILFFSFNQLFLSSFYLFVSVASSFSYFSYFFSQLFVLFRVHVLLSSFNQFFFFLFFFYYLILISFSFCCGFGFILYFSSQLFCPFFRFNVLFFLHSFFSPSFSSFVLRAWFHTFLIFSFHFSNHRLSSHVIPHAYLLFPCLCVIILFLVWFPFSFFLIPLRYHCSTLSLFLNIWTADLCHIHCGGKGGGGGERG